MEISEPLSVEELRALPRALARHHLEMMVYRRKLTPEQAVQRYLEAVGHP